MKEVIIRCDIQGCENTGAKSFNMQVLVNDGVKNLSCERLDICDECFEKVIKSGKYLLAEGSSLYHKYYIQS